METIFQKVTDWIKEILISGIMENMSGLFDSVNDQVGQIAGQVGTSPADFSPGVFALIRNVSESVIIPIAGMILTIIACWELIQMILDHNNLANFETWVFFKWIFKTFVAVMLISNTFSITMAVFDVAQYVVSTSGNLIQGSTAISSDVLAALEESLQEKEIGELFGIFLQSFIVQLTIKALAVTIFVIIYGRMVEIYCASRSAAFHPKAVCGHFGNPALASR